MDELGNYEASKFNDALTELAGAGGNPINVRATVTRIDAEGVSWASVNGKEFPLQGTTVRANPGEIVNVSYDGVSAHASGSYTDPAMGAEAVKNEIRSAVEPVRKIANESGETAEAAAKIAREAEAVAKATNQHFWDDDNGAHVTDVTQDEWTAAAADDFSDLSDTKPYHNLLMTSLGILLRRALNNLVSISKSAIAFYDGLGNAAGNIVARFGASGTEFFANGTSMAEFGGEGARIGDESGIHQVMKADVNSFMIGDDTVAYVSSDKFYSVNAEVEDAFYIGKYSIRNASDGTLVIGLRR